MTPSTVRQTKTDDNRSPWGITPLSHEYVSKVCDLDGFLGFMEREGRPMPSRDAVRVLRERLNSTNPQTGAKWIPFLNKLKLEQIELQDIYQASRYTIDGFSTGFMS